MIATVLFAAALAGATIETQTLSYAGAKTIVDTCLAKAKEQKWPPLGIAVIDNGGHVLYAVRQDGSRYVQMDFAIKKAETSLFTRNPSKLAMDRMIKGETWLLSVPGVVGMQGGLPAMVDGQAAGAVGVSGATSEQDEECARAGLKAIGLAPK